MSRTNAVLNVRAIRTHKIQTKTLTVGRTPFSQTIGRKVLIKKTLLKKIRELRHNLRRLKREVHHELHELREQVDNLQTAVASLQTTIASIQAQLTGGLIPNPALQALFQSRMGQTVTI